MIPLNIALKNFLSYGSTLQTINFTPYSFICLSGKNGHGKSALLDAITWALWGQARKITGASRADESLLRLSQKQMLVIFEFMANGVHYRVKREFYKTPSKNTVNLDFGFVDATGRPTPLTTKTIKDTQQLIIDTIGLDFETFVNSSFLKQGSSNEFSKKSPKERKEIIGNILSLNQYEIIKKRAVEKTRMISLSLDHLKITTAKKIEELQQYQSIPDVLQQTTEELILLQKHELDIKSTINLTEEDLHNLRIELNYTKTRSILQQEQIKEYVSLKNQLQNTYSIWKNLHQKRITYASKEILEQEKKIVETIIKNQQILRETHLKLQQEINELDQQKRTLEAKINEERFVIQTQYTTKKEALITEKKTAEHTMQKLMSFQKQHEITHANYQQELRNIAQEKEKNSKQVAKIIFYTKRFEKRKNTHQKINLLEQQLNTQLEDIDAKCILFKNNQNANCPLCKNTLDANTKEECLSSFLNEKKEITKKIDRIMLLQERLTQDLKNEEIFKKSVIVHTEQKEALQVKEHQLQYTLQQNIVQQHQQKIELENLHQHLSQLIVSLEQEEKTYQDAMKKLKKNEHIDVVQEKINLLHNHAHQNEYNESIYNTAQEDLKNLERFLYIDHASILMQLQNFKENIQNLCHLMKNKKREYIQENLTAKYQTLEHQEKILLQTLKEIKESLVELAQKKELLLQKKGTLEAQNKQREMLQKNIAQEEIDYKKLQKELHDYTLIAQATGKDGIQALIIEQAIPEIEYEANLLLSKLSNNQMHIMIESLKDLKSGKTKETLDIKISDAEGVRNYELFSGGESFRIDLSLRIAISKLLAHRAGTTLQTLIIDEGFGSQDEEGTSNIIDALYKIQEDFQKIIVVSHLNAIKEQIPVHFLVQKTAMGSSVSVVEQ